MSLSASVLDGHTLSRGSIHGHGKRDNDGNRDECLFFMAISSTESAMNGPPTDDSPVYFRNILPHRQNPESRGRRLASEQRRTRRTTTCSAVQFSVSQLFGHYHHHQDHQDTDRPGIMVRCLFSYPQHDDDNNYNKGTGASPRAERWEQVERFVSRCK